MSASYNSVGLDRGVAIGSAVLTTGRWSGKRGARNRSRIPPCSLIRILLVFTHHRRPNRNYGSSAYASPGTMLVNDFRDSQQEP
jgi:hypothetical protein